MVADCIEGILSHAIYIVIIITICFVINWMEIVQVMSHAEPGRSHINPFDAEKIEDFNIEYVAMGLLIMAYSTMALQNKQGFNSAARTAQFASSLRVQAPQPSRRPAAKYTASMARTSAVTERTGPPRTTFTAARRSGWTRRSEKIMLACSL